MAIKDRLLFFDTETVGISPNYIISLAYRYYVRGQKPICGIIECNPDYPITPEASEVNGYTAENTKDFPLFSELWPKISYMFKDSVWIGHNLAFDRRAINTELERYGLPRLHHYELDTLKMARKILNHDEVKNHKLITLSEYYNFVDENDSDKFHAADFDIWATDMLYRKFNEMRKEDQNINALFIAHEEQGTPIEVIAPSENNNSFLY